MTMETIPILYRIDGEQEGDINCFEMEAPAGKEVLLFDILKCWNTWHPGGVDYTFYARAGGTNMIQLESPACCVPVIDNRIYLLLKPCGYIPFAPPTQTIAWFEKSQRDIYGMSNAPPPRSFFSSWTTSSKSQSSSSTASNSQRPRDKKSQDNTGAAQSRGEPSSDRNRGEGDGGSGNWGRRDSTNASQGQSVSGNMAGIDMNQLAGAAEAASQAGIEAAGVAARSLFKFAASTMKTVVNTANSFTAGNVIQVGEHRVQYIKAVAEGGFGTVSLVKNTAAGSSGGYYAMKLLLCQTKEQLQEANNEIRVLQQFKGHPNIVEIVDTANIAVGKKSNVRQVYILMPYFHAGTCWDLIEGCLGSGADNQIANAAAGAPWCFNERQALEIILGTCRALIAMHEAGLVHNDIKPHNILLTDNMEPVVMDLGSAGPFQQIRSRRDALNLEEEAAMKCSAPYRCPELTQVASEVDIAGWCDIWSLGCTLFCLAFGHSPFENAKEGVLKLAILNGKFSFPPGMRNRDITFSDDFISLIEAMLRLDYETRPTAFDVKERVKEILEMQGGY